MAKERSVDEYLGFAQRENNEKQGDSTAAPTATVSEHGAYEDSWYQVLKAQAEEDKAAEPGDDDLA